MSERPVQLQGRAARFEPPVRVLLCLGPCHGEFYLPLDLDEAIVCPNDRTHPVAVYSAPTIHAGETP